MTDILVERDGAIATIVITRPHRRHARSDAMGGERARVTHGLGDDHREGTRVSLEARSPRFPER